MWIEINTETLEYKQDDLSLVAQSDGRCLLASATLIGKIEKVEDLASQEYGQAIEINRADRTVKFGRDYLGHFPLQYALTAKALIISDEADRIANWLKDYGTGLTVSKEAVALYMMLGYIPQGMTIFNEIVAAENAAYYLWQGGVVKKVSTFKPVEIDPSTNLIELKDHIRSKLTEYVEGFSAIDVWCSGGLDSSIIAYEAKETGKPVLLKTISYTDQATQWCYEAEQIARKENLYIRETEEPFELGELSFVKLIGDYFNLPVDAPALRAEHFWGQSLQMAIHQPNPIIDICVPVKYALSANTNRIALTGEGGDPIFSGTKNNFVSFMRQRKPDMAMGWIYALSHLRCGLHFNKLFKNDGELQGYITDYLQGLIDRYPGSLVRKLLYMNTFVKQGSLIFLESYYGAKQHGVQVRHPLTSLPVYETGFKLPEELKYVYPKGKIALNRAYRDDLPMDTIEREKSGTIVPLTYFLSKQPPPNVESLYGTGLFDNDYLNKIIEDEIDEDNMLIKYALGMLSNFLACHG